MGGTKSVKVINHKNLIKISVDDFVNNLIVIFPERIKKLFYDESMFFQLDDNGELLLGSTNVSDELHEQVTNKLNSYLESQPWYFVGLEYGEMH